MNDLELLQKVLEISIAKNGDMPLTLSHLKNLIGVARRMGETQDDRIQMMEEKWAAECGDPNH